MQLRTSARSRRSVERSGVATDAPGGQKLDGARDSIAPVNGVELGAALGSRGQRHSRHPCTRYLTASFLWPGRLGAGPWAALAGGEDVGNGNGSGRIIGVDDHDYDDNGRGG